LGDEYFLIENRQPKLFDQYLWNGGILVWHIDDTQPWMRERGYPGQEGKFQTQHHAGKMKLECFDLHIFLFFEQVGRVTADIIRLHCCHQMDGTISKLVEIAVIRLIFGAREWR
jgi:hypothetical protein